MPAWDHAIALDPAADQPIFLQIARAIADDVRRGRLRPGAALPGSRTLAATLGVHRNTVLSALRELEGEGWIATRDRVTRISTALPEPSPRRFARTALARTAVPTRAGFDLPVAHERWEPAATAPKGTLVFGSGVPDLRLLDVAPLARAYRRALRAHRALLSYADPRGEPHLRAAIGAMLSSLRGVAASADDVLVTRGSQMALDLVSRALLRPGDAVAVEALGYRPAWSALRQAGARLVPIPLDAGGLRVDLLEAAIERESLRAIYVTPHHQYPTTTVLSAARRLRLLALARAHRLAVIEDDYDFEFHYEGRPVLPLASADEAGVVIYVGTLSKILAPGLRLGFVVAPAPVAERLAAVRGLADRQGDHVLERAVAELMEDGEVQRHVRRARREYQTRRDVLAGALRSTFGDALEFRVPAGGMAMWARAPDVDVDAWAERALAAGVSFSTARRYAFDGRARPFLRLVFAALDARELREAVRRMASTFVGRR